MASALSDAELEAAAAADAERDAGAHDITGDEDEDTAATKLEAMRRGRAARARVAELNAKRLAELANAADAAEAVARALETGGDAMRQSPTPDPDADDEAVGSAPEHPDVLPPETETVAERAEDGSPGAPTRKTISATAADRAAAKATAADLEARVAAAELEEVTFEGDDADAPATVKLGVVSRGERAAANIDELRSARDDAARAAAALTFEASEEEAPIGPKEYVPEDMRRAPREYELHRSSVVMHHSFGFESTKRNNLHYLDDSTVIFTVGAMVQTLNLETLEQTYLYGIDGGGVGFVCVHPDKEHFVLGEKGTNPNVYVYERETLKLSKVLRGGTERAYSCGRFSPDGSMLATVGGYPDFWLTVWDWRDEGIVLRSKAFSQDVFDVVFSPFFEGRLTTAGTGHLRFWKMAETFTGLKLQGDIGRFGNEDLSDVAGYAELPDGKVLSGTESGRMLLWDGALIKAVLVRANVGGDDDSDGRPCHDGMIEFIKLDVDAGIFHTAGADGYVRTWDFAEVNDAEPGEDTTLVFIEPREEFRILADAASDVATSVKSIIMTEPDHWLVQDEGGGITKVALDESGRPGESRRLVGFHAGPINGLEVSRVSDHAVTVGQDGTVRVFAYVEKREVYAARFNAPATSLALAPARVDEESRVHVVGFDDGIVRVLLRCADRWKLLDCVKPHDERVTCALYAPKGAFLATGSHDGRVFFFSVTGARGAGLEPVGFATAPGPVSAMDWNDVGDKILVGCESGEIFEMAVPAVGSVDSTRTFEFEPEATHYAFKRPRPTAESIIAARAPPPSLDEMTPEEAKAAEKKLADEVAELQAEMDEEERTAVYPVRHIAYEPSGSFELAAGGEASGKIFTCALESPNPLTHVAIHDATITTVRTSLSRKITVSAASDGTVRVARLGSARYWQGEVHDSQNGAVAGATVSRDDAFLLSASADGSFFVQRLGPELRGLEPDAVAETETETETRASEGAGEEVAALVAPSADEDKSPEVEDILTSETYSIEEAKVKLEEDAKRASAEEKKLGTRGYVDKLKEEYLALVAENVAKPPSERLAPEAFEIDPGLRDIVEAETQAKMELMHKSLAWETEKATLGLKKLNEWFLDDVEEERVVLRSFAEGRRGFAVTNFRVAKLSDALRQDIHLVRNPPKEDEMPELRRSRSVSIKSRPSKNMSEATEEPEEENPFATGHKQELRRQRRKAREAEWRAFNATKPDEQYENPDDVAAIEVARNTLGDFKLKSAPDYVVPEEDSMNYRRKREQMLLLEEAIHDAKVDFNAEFAALRDVRARVVEQIQAVCARIAEITVELDDADRPEGIEALTAVAEPFRSTPLADEYPKESRETVTDVQLAAFDAKRKAEAAAKAAAEAAKAGGGFGGGGGATKKDKTEEPTETDGVEEETDRIAAAVAAAAAAKDAAAHPRETAAAACAPTPLEVSEAEARALRHGHERARLVAIRRDVVRRFDDALKALRRRKSFVEGELKTAEMTKLTYNQELVQLQRFENGEKLLREKLVAKTEEREDLDAEMEEIANKVEDKEDELEGVVERKNKVLKEFESVVDESHAHREYLEKVFLRRIKRAKKKPAGEDVAEKDGESGSESEEESDDDDDYDSEDEEEEACPAECDVNLWDQVLALRERRQDQDDVINEINKINAEHKKESDALAKKAKTVGKTLATLEQEMFEFQKEKLETLNAIESTVTLRLRQVEYLYEGKIPNDLAEGIVFSRSVLDGLQRRIEELVGEKSALRRQQRDLRREHASLQKVKAERTEKNRELDASAVQMQMLKFGQLIDLEKLERAMIPKKGTEELKVMLKAQDAANREEKRKWNADLAKARGELTAMTAQNTACLNAVADLTTRQRDLEARLMTTQQSVFVDPNAARRKEIAERDHLVAVINAQAKEIDTLKAEIAVLSVKGRPQHMPFS